MTLPVARQCDDRDSAENEIGTAGGETLAGNPLRALRQRHPSGASTAREEGPCPSVSFPSDLRLCATLVESLQPAGRHGHSAAAAALSDVHTAPELNHFRIAA